MNKEILKTNLIKTINIMDSKINFINYDVQFRILPVLEKTKKHTSLDDWMYLCGFKDIFDKMILLNIDNVIDIIITPDGKIPVMINIKLSEINEKNVIFLLEVSMRFRKAKGLDLKNYTFIPFKIIY